MSKVAPISLAFWIMKICATTLGETAGDMVSMTLNLGYATSSVLLLLLFVVALTFQLKSDAFRPVLYWSVILTTSTAGTTISDFMDRTLALGYATGTAILACVLGLILLAWYGKERSLAVSDIRSRRVESFYWSAILVSNTLGTALGDFLADDSGLGFAGGAMLIASAIAILGALWRWTNIQPTLLFWSAFVLTRPFGATLGDLLTKPSSAGGLALGTIGSSTVLLLILIAMILYTATHTPTRRPLTSRGRTPSRTKARTMR